MPRLMSVSLTEPQVRDRSKTVTRRVGWTMLRPGDRLTLCRKVMGRRRGDPLVRIVDIEVASTRREPLNTITAADVAAEGFPQMSTTEFVEFFCATHRGCRPDTLVTRIEWRYLDDTAQLQLATTETDR
ncbi:ASCH domain-containing protein [Nocardia sp. X0981]